MKLFEYFTNPIKMLTNKWTYIVFVPLMAIILMFNNKKASDSISEIIDTMESLSYIFNQTQMDYVNKRQDFINVMKNIDNEILLRQEKIKYNEWKQTTFKNVNEVKFPAKIIRITPALDGESASVRIKIIHPYNFNFNDYFEEVVFSSSKVWNDFLELKENDYVNFTVSNFGWADYYKAYVGEIIKINKSVDVKNYAQATKSYKSNQEILEKNKKDVEILKNNKAFEY